MNINKCNTLAIFVYIYMYICIIYTYIRIRTKNICLNTNKYLMNNNYDMSNYIYIL